MAVLAQPSMEANINMDATAYACLGDADVTATVARGPYLRYSKLKKPMQLLPSTDVVTEVTLQVHTSAEAISVDSADKPQSARGDASVLVSTTDKVRHLFILSRNLKLFRSSSRCEVPTDSTTTSGVAGPAATIGSTCNESISSGSTRSSSDASCEPEGASVAVEQEITATGLQQQPQLVATAAQLPTAPNQGLLMCAMRKLAKKFRPQGAKAAASTSSKNSTAVNVQAAAGDGSYVAVVPGLCGLLPFSRKVGSKKHS